MLESAPTREANIGFETWAEFGAFASELIRNRKELSGVLHSGLLSISMHGRSRAGGLEQLYEFEEAADGFNIKVSSNKVARYTEKNSTPERPFVALSELVGFTNYDKSYRNYLVKVSGLGKGGFRDCKAELYVDLSEVSTEELKELSKPGHPLPETSDNLKWDNTCGLVNLLQIVINR